MKLANLNANTRLEVALGRSAEYEEALRLSDEIGEAIDRIKRQDDLHKLLEDCPICRDRKPKNLVFVLGSNNLACIACMGCFLHGPSMSTFNFPNDNTENYRRRAIFLWNVMVNRFPEIAEIPLEYQILFGLANQTTAQTS